MVKPELVFRNFDTSKYRFREVITKIFEQPDLENIHLSHVQHLPDDQLEFATESRTWFHNTFYSALHSEYGELFNMYDRFVADEIAPLFEAVPFIYQTFPTFRIHLPERKAISKWHYDSDADHRHPPYEINFQIPVTKCFDTSATWIESKPGAGDFKPMEMNYGQYAQFDGNKCKHGNKLNETGLTRISFDFRVMKYDDYQKSYIEKSATANKSFEIGSYYKLYTGNI
jgi:hypothetical protein